MQPDRDKTDWKQPTAQPSQAPYVSAPQKIQPPASAVAAEMSAETKIDSENMSMSQKPLDTERDGEVPPTDTVSDEQPVRWHATEYIHHDRDPLWFVVFAAVVVILMAISIFLIQAITFTILIPIMAVTLLVYARRPPRVIDYTLSHQGLHVNDRLYTFDEFKGFGVVHDDLEYSVLLLPVKRFRLSVSIYFPEEAGEAIVDILGTRLPMQELRLDPFDKVVHKLRL
jgi:hypothetical protein